MKINWRTDTPTEELTECITTRETKLGGEVKRYVMFNGWGTKPNETKPDWFCNVLDGSYTIAWCPLSEIEPYNPEEK